MKNQLIRRSSILILAVLMLTGCSSKATVEEAVIEETTVVEEAPVEVEKATPVEEVTPESTVEEAAPEPATESTPEPIVYEGIDMESTLPGKEWIKSFEGIIEEPKLVVFNDTTNKKVILENNQEVEFAADDILAIYMPENTVLVKHDLDTFSNVYYESPFIMEGIGENIWKRGSFVSNNILEYNGEEITLSATLIFVD